MKLFVKSFKGRLNRRNYLFWLILYIIVGILFQGFIFNLQSTLTEPFASVYTTILSVPFIFVAFLFGISIHVKRFHDLGYTGHFTWLGLIPVVNIILGTALLFQVGQHKQNKFGDIPEPCFIFPLSEGNESFLFMLIMIGIILLHILILQLSHIFFL